MFSVIIPLYNKASFIKRAVNSVLNQSYKDFEIIIVNDGSTDDSLNVVEQFENASITIVNQLNSGVSVARNTGARIAKNKYLAFLDGDDEWDKDFLLEIKCLIEKYPKAGIYATNNYFIYPNGRRTTNEIKNNWFKNNTDGVFENYFQVFSNLQRSPFSNSNFCLPKDIYEQIGGYKVGVKLTEDSDLWCRIAFDYLIVYSTKPLATYYLAQEGSTNKIFENKPFQVTYTLQNYLNSSNVKTENIKPVSKLISLQKLGLIKRGIITQNKSKVLVNFFDVSILIFYPIEYLKCILALLLPNRLL